MRVKDLAHFNLEKMAAAAAIADNGKISRAAIEREAERHAQMKKEHDKLKERSHEAIEQYKL